VGTENAGQSLNAKLIVAVLLVAMPAVALVGGISFYALRDLNLANRDLQEISRSLEAVRALEGGLGRALIPLSVSLQGSTSDVRFAGAMREIETALQSCAYSACHGASAQPREMAQRLAPHVRGIAERAAALFDADGADRIRLIREIGQSGEDVSRQLQRMSTALLVRVGALEQRSDAVYQRARGLIVGSIVVVVPLAILIAYLVLRQWVLAQEIEAHRARLETLVAAKTSELEQAHESLMRSEKLAAIGVLSAGVAHELNNPLTSVLMNVNLLMEDLDEQPDLQRELKRVSDDVLRCQRIIDALRDFSRRHELAIRTCNLNDLVTDVLALTKRQLDLQHIALTCRLEPLVPPVNCDSDRIRQVLLNVLVNAIQATPRGGSLNVATDVRDGCVAISVADTGAGIDAGIRSRIFDPFFTTKPDGTGLGLSIAYRIMEEHRGKVEIRSLTAIETASGAGPETGTLVRLLLPVEA